MAKKIAVVLSGCGYQQGAEITESVSTLVALDQAGASVQVFAPASALAAVNQVARGKALDLAGLKAENFDGLALPGGYGVMQVLWKDENMARALRDFYAQAKPIAAICIAPALVAHVLGKNGITVTVGEPGETADQIAATGAIHESCAVDDFISDRDHRIISTPAYMFDQARPQQVFRGVSLAMQELVEMA